MTTPPAGRTSAEAVADDLYRGLLDAARRWTDYPQDDALLDHAETLPPSQTLRFLNDHPDADFIPSDLLPPVAAALAYLAPDTYTAAAPPDTAAPAHDPTTINPPPHPRDNPDLTPLADLHGRMDDGYTPDTINTVFDRIEEATGLNLVCVWDYRDDHGFGGNSQWYATDPTERLWELDSELYRWLSAPPAHPAPPLPDPRNWITNRATGMPKHRDGDDRHNHAARWPT